MLGHVISITKVSQGIIQTANRAELNELPSIADKANSQRHAHSLSHLHSCQPAPAAGFCLLFDFCFVLHHNTLHLTVHASTVNTADVTDWHTSHLQLFHLLFTLLK